jgi:hypothetical protein
MRPRHSILLDNGTRGARRQIEDTVTDEETMSEAIQYDRRRFIGTAMMATAGAGLVGSRLREPGSPDESGPAALKTSTNGSPGPIKQVNAGLNVGYTEAGPSNGPPAILLHEGPYSIKTDVDAAPLAARGYRVIVPHVERRWAPEPRSDAALLSTLPDSDALNLQGSTPHLIPDQAP